MQTSSTFDALATDYARSRLPDADPAEIAAAVRRLRGRIDRGELNIVEVTRRLRMRLHAPAVQIPSNVGDLARAVRDLDAGRLSESEREFVADMCRRGFGYRPTDRQIAYLRHLFVRRAAA